MLGAVVLALGLAMLMVTACLAALSLRLDSLTRFCLAVHLIAWADVVVTALALSTVDAFTRPAILVCLAAWLCVATVLWSRRGRPRPVAIRPRIGWLWSCLHRPHHAVLGVALAGGYGYLIALGLLTPQNDRDPLVYQLARAALWRQADGVGLIDVPIEPRLDVNPIVAEVGQATSLILAGSERFVWLVQLSSVAALAFGAFAVARRVGLSASQALFGAMLVPALPVVATQSITGYNDLVVASFVVSATVFVLGVRRLEVIPLALAVALAVGTKFTAPFALPVVVLAGALGQPLRRWPALGAAVVGGSLLGGGWHIANYVRTGSLDGGLAAAADQEPRRALGPVAETAQRLLLDSLELPGTSSAGILVLLAAGVALIPLGIHRAARGHGRSVVLAGVIVVATPIAVEIASGGVGWLFGLAWDARGSSTLATEVRRSEVSKLADGAGSWYGPLATFVGLAVLIVASSRVRRGTLARPAVVLAAAPWIGIVILAAAITYDEWRGRFLAGVWVLNVAVWGLLERYRAAAVSIACVTAVTFLLCLAQFFGRPLGIDALSEFPRESIWRVDRWDAQTIFRGSSPRRHGETQVLRAVEESVPGEARIAVSLWNDDLLYPYFGPGLRRHVRVLDVNAVVPRDARWLVTAPEVTVRGCPDQWQSVVSHDTGWRLYRRIGPTGCVTPRPLRTPQYDPSADQ